MDLLSLVGSAGVGGGGDFSSRYVSLETRVSDEQNIC